MDNGRNKVSRQNSPTPWTYWTSNNNYWWFLFFMILYCFQCIYWILVWLDLNPKYLQGLKLGLAFKWFFAWIMIVYPFQFNGNDKNPIGLVLVTNLAWVQKKGRKRKEVWYQIESCHANWDPLKYQTLTAGKE